MDFCYYFTGNNVFHARSLHIRYNINVNFAKIILYLMWDVICYMHVTFISHDQLYHAYRIR